MAAPRHTWLTRRRIQISLVGFTSLVVFNVFILGTIPHNPLAFSDPPVALAILLLLSGLGIRSWSAGTLSKSRTLTMVGPYSLVRNPLYLGSFLMMVGFCILCRDWPTLVFVSGPLAVVYWYQVRFEEQRLRHLFPKQWPDYVRSTPRFFPGRVSRQVFAGWSLAEWMRNREYQALAATSLGIAAVLMWFWLRTQT